MWGEY
ncbi:hypothetical protein ECEC1866_1561, partial [Escherichia coli EC1866]